MRRYALFFLLALVLAAPFVLRPLTGRRAAPAPAQALRLVIITAHQEGIRREFAQAFDQWHRRQHGAAVTIDYLNYGGSDIEKVFRDRAPSFKVLGNYQIDLVWGGGDYLFDNRLKNLGCLEPVDLPVVDPDAGSPGGAYPAAELAGVPLYDRGRPPSWFGAALSSFGIVYNKDVCRHLQVELPRTWSDLADPRWDGWVILADPTRSSSAKQVYMIIVERAMADAVAQGRSEDEGWARGMGLIRQIAANARLFTDSSSVVPIQVSTGDAGAGMAIDFYGRSQSDVAGEQRMSYVEPAQATAITPDPIALVRGAPQRELAVRFMRFVLSETGQRLWNARPGSAGGPQQTSLRRLPIRRSVYENPVYLADFVDKANPFQTAGAFNKSARRQGTQVILGELIQFACIDPLRELRQTRRLILSSPQAKRLDAKLGMFPFDQREALRRARQWKEATEAVRLELGRAWAAQFRAEYAALRQEAGP